MIAWYAVAAGLLVLTGGVAYWWRHKPAAEGGPPTEVLPAPVDREPMVRTPDRVLVPAPRIGDATLRDWLIHQCRRDNVWSEVVAEFYTAAAADPEIAAHFEHTDMARLQRHFLAALLVLTHTGLTVGTMDAMRERHAGLGITGPVFDRTILALAGVLGSKGVPTAAIQQLLPAVDRLRGVIVAAPVS